MRVFSDLILLTAAILASAEVFVHNDVKVESYHVHKPMMVDSKRNVIKKGIDTRISTQTRSPQGHYIHKRSVDIMIDLFGQEQILKMKLNEDLIHPDYHVIYGGPEGVLNITYGIENCYYNGFVEGDPTSFMAISTCGQRLEGMFNLDGEFFIITPKDEEMVRKRSEDDEGFEHVVYKNDDAMQPPFSCGVDHEDIRFTVKQFDKVDHGHSHDEDESQSLHKSKRATKYVEFFAVNDYSRTTSYGAKLQDDTVNLMSAVNQLYISGSFSNIDGLLVISLIGQYVPTSELWQNGVTKPDANTLLDEFCAWRQPLLGATTDAQGINDNAQLLSGRDFVSGGSSGVAGLAWVGTMCSTSNSCGISEAMSSRTVASTSLIVAHEMGHNFNSPHDSSGNTCPSSGYIMAAVACSNCNTWSSCSTNTINNFLNQITCLNNAPRIAYPDSNLCGNYVVDSGEQCDYGKTGTTCCSGRSATPACSWLNGATCDNSSPCCSNCQLRPTTYVCRASAATCDMDDYCSVDGKCSDTKRPDGYSCATDSVCSTGNCVSRATQCTNLNGYTFTVGGVAVSGPFTPCNTASCYLNCQGSTSTTCVSMQSFSFPNELKYSAKGLSCTCTGGKAGVCPGNSATCDCTVQTTTTTTTKTTTTTTAVPTTTTTTTTKATTTTTVTPTTTTTKTTTTTVPTTTTTTKTTTTTPTTTTTTTAVPTTTSTTKTTTTTTVAPTTTTTTSTTTTAVPTTTTTTAVPTTTTTTKTTTTTTAAPSTTTTTTTTTTAVPTTTTTTAVPTTTKTTTTTTTTVAPTTTKTTTTTTAVPTTTSTTKTTTTTTAAPTTTTTTTTTPIITPTPTPTIPTEVPTEAPTEPPTSAPCNRQTCNDHGNCLGGVCYCDFGWAGTKCDQIPGCDGVAGSGKVVDACGVCGGNGLTCAGCDGVPNSGKNYDSCGVCGGSNTCLGCDGVPNSGKTKDVCGVCGGDGKSCLGCDGVVNSTKVLDLCGVCGGNSSSCKGCDGVINSGKVLDACGICDGDGSTCLGCDGVPNSGKIIDLCGICGGTNACQCTGGKGCLGCDGIPDSGKIYDLCGICGGSNTACAGCDGKANSGKIYDLCGVCGGNNSTCKGCDGLINSGKVLDVCGVCGGNGQSCRGCDGVINSGKVFDVCGVCGGSGSTCLGCDGVPNSGKIIDRCDVCGGSNACVGCDGVPNSGKVFDFCGVCGGTGSSCPGDNDPCSLQGKKVDVCGVCGGDGTSCLGCDGVVNSGLVIDACAICGGNNGTCSGCDGIPFSGKVKDACEVCGGDSSSCKGCDGIVNSANVFDECHVCGGDNFTCSGCDGVPNSGKTKDVCGECGGNGSLCGGYERIFAPRIEITTIEEGKTYKVTATKITESTLVVYTLDGTSPNFLSSTQYTQPFTLDYTQFINLPTNSPGKKRSLEEREDKVTEIPVIIQFQAYPGPSSVRLYQSIISSKTIIFTKKTDDGLVGNGGVTKIGAGVIAGAVIGGLLALGLLIGLIVYFVVAKRAKKAEKDGRKKLKAIYEYRAQNKDEIDLQVNDVVTLKEEFGDGWCIGTNERSRKEGMFPKSYVQEVDTSRLVLMIRPATIYNRISNAFGRGNQPNQPTQPSKPSSLPPKPYGSPYMSQGSTSENPTYHA